MKNKYFSAEGLLWLVVFVGAVTITNWLAPHNFWLGLVVATIVGAVVWLLWKKVVDDKKKD